MNWNDLTMAQKNELMQTYIRNGVTSLEDMRSHFNSFGEGGPKKTYKEWSNQMQTKYPWLELDPNKAGYDYERYFNENYNDAMARLGETQARHFIDRYKLVNHPTYSNESVYSQGPRIGGEWTKDDKFIPSVINRQQYPKVYDQDRAYTEKEIYDKLHRFDEGGPTGAVKKAIYDRMPIAGTFVLPEVDITPEPEKPNWFARQSVNAAMAENAPYMQAVGWQQDREGNYHQDPTTPGAEELRKALFEIGMNGAMDVFGGPAIEAGLKAVKTSKAVNAFLDRTAEALVRQGDNLRTPADWDIKGMLDYMFRGKKHPELAYKAGLYSGEDVIGGSRKTLKNEIFSPPHKGDVVDAFFNKTYQLNPSSNTKMNPKLEKYISKNYPDKDIKIFDLGNIDYPPISKEMAESVINDPKLLGLEQVVYKDGKGLVDVGGHLREGISVNKNNLITNNWDIWKFKGSDLIKHNDYGRIAGMVGDFIDSRGTPLVHTWNNVYPIKALGGYLF